MRARIFRYITAACNAAIFILAIALPYLAGKSLFQVAGGVGDILSPDAAQHFTLLSLGLWCMIILPVACAAMWAIEKVPRWVVMLVQLAQLLIALVVSIFLLWFANELDRSFSGIAMDLVSALFGGDSVLANYVSTNFYVHLILSLFAMFLGAFAEQEYDDDDVQDVAPAMRPPSLIECLSGHFKGEVFPIEPGQSLIFGRDPDECDVVFPADDVRVSRKHCVVSLRPDGYVYQVQCMSSNGMLVAGEVCANEQKKTVKKGTEICLGDKENIFVLA